MQRAAEIIGDVVLTVGERARAAKAAHDGTALAADAGFDLLAVNGAAALAQRMAGLEHGHLHDGIQLQQFIGGENAAGACADNDHVIIHEDIQLLDAQTGKVDLHTIIT